MRLASSSPLIVENTKHTHRNKCPARPSLRKWYLSREDGKSFTHYESTVGVRNRLRVRLYVRKEREGGGGTRKGKRTRVGEPWESLEKSAENWEFRRGEEMEGGVRPSPAASERRAQRPLLFSSFRPGAYQSEWSVSGQLPCEGCFPSTLATRWKPAPGTPTGADSAAADSTAQSWTATKGAGRGRAEGAWHGRAWVGGALFSPPPRLPPPPATRTEGAGSPPPARPRARAAVGQDVGLPGGTARREAGDGRGRRGGRALAGRPRHLVARALLRLQPERPLCAAQRQPGRLLRPPPGGRGGRAGGWSRAGVGSRGGCGAGATAPPGDRLRVLRPGPATVAGLRAGHAVAGAALQGETQEGERRGPRRPPTPGLGAHPVRSWEPGPRRRPPTHPVMPSAPSSIFARASPRVPQSTPSSVPAPYLGTPRGWGSRGNSVSGRARWGSLTPLGPRTPLASSRVERPVPTSWSLA